MKFRCAKRPDFCATLLASNFLQCICHHICLHLPATAQWEIEKNNHKNCYETLKIQKTILRSKRNLKIIFHCGWCVKHQHVYYPAELSPTKLASLFVDCTINCAQRRRAFIIFLKLDASGRQAKHTNNSTFTAVASLLSLYREISIRTCCKQEETALMRSQSVTNNPVQMDFWASHIHSFISKGSN